MSGNIAYRVTMIRTVSKQCPLCLGIGSKKKKIGPGMEKTVQCLHCKGGVSTHEEQTTIGLKEALMDIGIINLIQNVISDLNKNKNTGV